MRAAPQQRAVAAGAGVIPGPRPAATTKAQRIAQLRDLFAQGHSMKGAARAMGLSRVYVRRLAEAAGLKPDPEAVKKMVAAKKAATRRRTDKRSPEERARVRAATIAAMSAKLGIDLAARNQRIIDLRREGWKLPEIAKAVGCGERAARHVIERAIKSGILRPFTATRAPKPDLTPEIAAHKLAEAMRKSRITSDEQMAAFKRAQDHVRRCAALPPVTDAEVADLVAQFLARGGRVTVCPPRAAEVVNSGAGFVA